MASPSIAPALVERTEIHKSCRSVEALLSILNEYCEAASAVVSLQKKLAKALKDAASTKATAEIPASAMLASANIFESLSDIDSKFSKIIDREYDVISNEVKKWFKKLSKEEKTHDERMSSANARIKQAGQVYEKKSKKKAADVSEEHARYINLISTLGPEISQEKYNHAASISQRHTTLTYSVAACLSRLADFEWQKSCEYVRRFSPTVGPLGRYRSLCEGGWTGEMPPNLPDISISDDVSTPRMELNTALKPPDEDTLPRTRIIPEPTHSPGQQRVALQSAPPSLVDHPSDPQQDNALTYSPPSTSTQSGNPAQVSDPALPPHDTLEPPRAPFVDPNTGSVRSLSDFPVPPTHFPIPPAQPPHSLPTQPSTSLLEFPSRSPQAESPVSEAGIPRRQDRTLDEFPEGDRPDGLGPSNVPHSSGPLLKEQRFIQQPAIPERAETELAEQSFYNSVSQTSLSTSIDNRPTPPTYRSTTFVEIKPLNPKLYRDRDPAISREFGVLGDKPPTPTKSRTMENYRRSVERTDTGTSTTGSLVAAMRNRYDNNSGSTSPPRDLPRLPLSVNDIAARYQAVSPKLRTASPPVSRRQSLPLLETSALSAHDSNIASPYEERRRQQRREDSPEVSRRNDEQVIRERELELEARARELDRDRARLQALREGREHNQEVEYGRQSDGSESGHLGARPRERRVSLRHQLQRPRIEHDDLANTTNRMPTSRALPARPRTQESYPQHLGPPMSSNHQLTPPASMVHQIHSPKPSHPSTPLLQQSEDLLHESQLPSRHHRDDSKSNTASTTASSSSHAPFCGCETCSVSKYRSSGSGTSEQASVRKQQNSPTESKRSEKSKLGAGWIRRLSMPVVNGKKHQSSSSVGSTSNYALGSGITGGITSSKSAGLFMLDSKKNGSSTGLGVREDGKLSRPGISGIAARRSYDLNGVNNRSMTNLALRR